MERSDQICLQYHANATSGRVVRHVPSFEDSSEVSDQGDGEQRKKKKKRTRGKQRKESRDLAKKTITGHHGW